ncbi:MULTISPECIES: hypothetical protein [Actinomadura]|uniref:Uncharacterized protein n=1 Tax=Actinomadura yumaensis TaxID=111807 RepID=A0ABW2CPQ4_9ACTN|nr:hypothetical protein [Actinomadura sp. J1-007]MWK40509.1 hypothetical protein [Actinomadura sp. J1-007]
MSVTRQSTARPRTSHAAANGAEQRPCFSWEIIDTQHGPQGLGSCGVSQSKPGALRALSEALLSARPGTVGEVWRTRPSLVRPAVYVYEGLVARGVHDGSTLSVVWQ